MFKFLLIVALPIACLLFFIYQQDKVRPEPKVKLLVCFALGMAAGMVGGFIQLVFSWFGIGVGYDTIFYADFLCEVVVSAVCVSLCYLVLWKHSTQNPDFDEFTDGPVYMVCIAFGYEMLCSLDLLFSDEWSAVSLVSIFVIAVMYLVAITMGYYYSLAFFGKMEMTTGNKVKMWIIPFAILCTFNLLVDFCNQVLLGQIILFIISGGIVYVTYLKHKAIFAKLHHLEEEKAAAAKAASVPDDQPQAEDVPQLPGSRRH